jgi:hypothetical protein
MSGVPDRIDLVLSGGGVLGVGHVGVVSVLEKRDRVHADSRHVGWRASRPNGHDRDEYPPAVWRGNGAGLTRGSDPTGWRADVRFVASAESRSHGSSMGAQPHAFCNGTRFRYVFR